MTWAMAVDLQTFGPTRLEFQGKARIQQHPRGLRTWECCGCVSFIGIQGVLTQMLAHPQLWHQSIRCSQNPPMYDFPEIRRYFSLTSFPL